MEYRSYNKELAYANMLFKRPFSNIAIERDGKLIKFNCVIGNRSRIFKNLENPKRSALYNFPLIIIQRTGITKNDDRLANVWNEVKYATHSKKLNYNIFTPVPIDITYEVTIVSKYPGDIDMAISNFIPFFNKDLYFSCQHPKFADIQFTSQVIMDNNINEDHPDELDATQDDLVTATCTFTYKTFIFCGNTQSKPRTVITSMISTCLSGEPYTTLSSVLTSYTLDELLVNQEIIDTSKKLTCYINKEVTAYPEVSIEVSTEISVIDNPFTSPIGHIHVGFYGVPLLCAHVPYMDFVDQLSASGIDDSPHVDRFVYALNDLSDDYDWMREYNMNDPRSPELPNPHIWDKC